MADSSEGLMVIPDGIDLDRFITEEIDTSREPHYTISEMSKFFFNRAASWIRWRERHGFFILDAEYSKEKKLWVAGEKSTEYGMHRTPEGARYYTLNDVEGIAHSLAQKEAINGTQLVLAVRAVKVQAQIFGYIA